jgi:cation diffusion facilitator CzcD-associated flavoprotein CzcO
MRWLAAALLGVVLSASVQAATVEARLIRASNGTDKTEEQLTKLEPKLKKVFGYQHYQQLGLQRGPLKENSQLRLDLGEGIVILVTPRAAEKKGQMMDFEMYSGRAALVKSSVRVGHGELLVKGPEVGNMLLVVSLAVVE